MGKYLEIFEQGTWVLIGIVDYNALTIEILKYEQNTQINNIIDGKFRLELIDQKIPMKINKVIISKNSFQNQNKAYKVLNPRHVYSYTLPAGQ